MASLLLSRRDGASETRELSRSQPLTIGRQPFNDICVPDDAVAPLHCRISWNKKAFEVTAATSGGVDVNSTTVAHANLKHGDTIRVGYLDLVFQEEAPPSRPPTQRAKSGGESHSSKKGTAKVEVPTDEADQLSLYSGIIATESQAMMESLFDDTEGDSNAKHEAARSPQPSKDEVLQVHKLRPGEQDVFKSPLVLGLTLGGLVLLLVTGIFWFLIVREQSNKQYDRAVAELNDGQYAQAITSFERFIAQYPGHSLRRQAERGLAKSHILKEISGASPAWARGLERLNELIKSHRNESDFSDLHSSIFQDAEQISLGAAKSAEAARDASLLVISKDAQVLLERYADPTTPPTAAIGRINEQRVKADRAIEKQKAFDVAMQTVDTALTNRKPMQALSERERLIKRFPEFVNSPKVRESLQKSLELEKSVIVVDEMEQAADTTDDGTLINEVPLGILLTRSRSDEVSQGRVVFVLAKDTCYAVDAVTGELLWRRAIGSDAPFFPVLSNGAIPTVLIFDGNKRALLCCHLSTGKLAWKQALNGRAIGAPLVHEGQIYQAVDGSQLVRIDVDTGRISARAKFSQDLATTPVLSRNGEFLLVPGQMAMIYSLAVRTTKSKPPLSAVATTFTDHSAGSITAPPLSMGRLFLVCENDRIDSANLRLWDAGNPAEPLKELSATRTTGQVRDTPILRGNQLVVPSAGEQFAAFVVTDEPERAGMAPVGQYRADQAKDQVDSPLFVSLGADGQFWSAGSAFRKFEIVGDRIRMDSNATAFGIASQPLQLVGDNFFVGRKSRYSDAVTFSAIERDKLVTPWRCILGDQPLELLQTREGGAFWVGESGTLYSLSKNRLLQGGADAKAGADLELPTNITLPIRATALPDQRMVVMASGATSVMFLLNSSGQLISKTAIDAQPETDPILLDVGLVLPLPSKLKVISLAPGKKPVMDWVAPVGEGVHHQWAHLLRVDGRELITIEKSGLISRIQYREGDVPHLADIAKLTLQHPVDVRPVLRGDTLYLAEAGGVCRQLNIHSFDTDGERALPAPVRNLWLAGTSVIAWAGDRKLYCLSEGNGLPERWTFELDSLEPVGHLIIKDETLWMACRNGTVVAINASTGKELRRMAFPQTLALGLRQIGDLLVAIASDGAIYRIE